MKKLSYVDGEIVELNSTGSPIIVAHICNNLGLWCDDNSAVIARRWPQAKRGYLQWYRGRVRNDFGLGAVQFVAATRQHAQRMLRIANMIAQSNAKKPVRYRFLRSCLQILARKAKRIGATIHMPHPHKEQFDSWPDIEAMIVGLLCKTDLEVTIYTPPPKHDGKWFGEVVRPTRKRYEIHD